jgi:hypothetical protein
MQKKLLVTSLIIAAVSAQADFPAFNIYQSCEGNIAFFTQDPTTGLLTPYADMTGIQKIDAKNNVERLDLWVS